MTPLSCHVQTEGRIRSLVGVKTGPDSRCSETHGSVDSHRYSKEEGCELELESISNALLLKEEKGKIPDRPCTPRDMSERN